jgi:hypothetical protein
VHIIKRFASRNARKIIMMPLPEENCAERVKHERRNLVVIALWKNSFAEDASDAKTP